MDIPTNWVPVHMMTTTKSLGRGVIAKTVKRKQFPVVSACAITIHKSQGGTFNELVYEYERRHEHSLVYVALSRATCLQGLHLTSPKNDFVFYHGKNAAKSTLPMQDEYKRLRSNKIVTLQDQIMEKVGAASETALIFTVFNCQSLRANAKNLDDLIIRQSKILLLSETWLLNEDPVPDIENFKVVSRFKNNANNVRGGGVAIFLRTDETFNYLDSVDTIADETGDSCSFTHNYVGKELQFICIYVRPNSRFQDITHFLGKILATHRAGELFCT